MRFTLPWLAEHLETEAGAEEIAAKLTALGLEVEEILDPGRALQGFTVARVLEARPHPNADRLKLCTVQTRDGIRQIVCGAPNARAGLWGVLATEGLVIPATGEVLRRAVIRGVESQGMLCSARELGLGDDHAGIIELEPEGLEVGMPAARALGLEGPVFVLKLTPNRADCFGVAGIARDLAAAGIGRLKSRDFRPVAAIGGPGPAIRLAFPEGAEGACPLFVGRMIRGVRNGRSPAWLRHRLEAVGLRPISALVDITNYVTFDLARPLHVFDADALAGDLVVRFARPGERLLALDGREYELDDGMIVIADATGPASLAGIIGGERTGVSEHTRNVLLEVALFDPLRIAATGRRLGVESEARTRFERGVDPELALPATEYATRLILDLCGGEPGPVIVAGAIPPRRPPLRFRTSQLSRLAGIALPPEEIRRILEALGFGVEGGPEIWSLAVPSWRQDVTTEACVVEELARLHGFERIPPVSVTRAAAVSPVVLSAEQRRRAAVRRSVAAQGLAEAVTWSFVHPEHAALFGGAAVRIENPLSSELSVLRASLLPGLLAAAARNLARKQEEGAIFELGPRFTGDQPGEQVWAVAGIRWGRAQPRHWAVPERPVDALDAKADALAALEAAGVRTEPLVTAPEPPPWYHPGRAGRLMLGPRTVALFGELHPAVLEAFDIEVPVVAFELDLDPLPKPKPRIGKARPPLEPLPFPPVDRDFAFLVDRDLPAQTLLEAVRAAEKKLLREVRLFDVYEGPGIPAGKKSLAVAVRLQAPDHTLSEAEIEAAVQRITSAVEKSCAAQLRR
ncbi:MAG: phenylalanine--tRNA ligase subunit beta [Geminicoccaceae bacterium]|nr:phenylalanine--tRNA ligase subunit beta [Geminicoccaceae bacterium]